MTDELEYQSKQTEKLLSKNQALEENVSILKRDVEIHKKVELELAQKSQKAQNEINALSKKVKEAEKVKEQLTAEHKEALQEFKEENNPTLDQGVYTLEKKLNDLHKQMLDMKKKKEKLEAECARTSASIKLLREGEHSAISLLLDFMNNVERGTIEEEVDEVALNYFENKLNLREM